MYMYMYIYMYMNPTWDGSLLFWKEEKVSCLSCCLVSSCTCIVQYTHGSMYMYMNDQSLRLGKAKQLHLKTTPFLSTCTRTSIPGMYMYCQLAAGTCIASWLLVHALPAGCWYMHCQLVAGTCIASWLLVHVFLSFFIMYRDHACTCTVHDWH